MFLLVFARRFVEHSERNLPQGNHSAEETHIKSFCANTPRDIIVTDLCLVCLDGNAVVCNTYVLYVGEKDQIVPGDANMDGVSQEIG